mgnify:CR=1 FL=1
MAKDMIDQVIPELKNLYTILEVDFDPLNLCKKVDFNYLIFFFFPSFIQFLIFKY